MFRAFRIRRDIRRRKLEAALPPARLQPRGVVIIRTYPEPCAPAPYRIDRILGKKLLLTPLTDGEISIIAARDRRAP